MGRAGTLVDSLQLNVSIDLGALRKSCDPDNFGVILWEAFRKAVPVWLFRFRVDNEPYDF